MSLNYNILPFVWFWCVNWCFHFKKKKQTNDQNFAGFINIVKKHEITNWKRGQIVNKIEWNDKIVRQHLNNPIWISIHLKCWVKFKWINSIQIHLILIKYVTWNLAYNTIKLKFILIQKHINHACPKSYTTEPMNPFQLCAWPASTYISARY